MEKIQSLIQKHHTAMKKRIDEVAHRLDDVLINASRQLQQDPDNPILKEKYDAIDTERQAIIDHQQALQQQLWQTYYEALTQPDTNLKIIEALAAELYSYLIPNLYNPRGKQEILIPSERKRYAIEQEEATYPILIQIRHLRQRTVKLTQDITYNSRHIPTGSIATYTDIHAGSDMGFKFEQGFISENEKIDGVAIFSYLTIDDTP